MELRPVQCTVHSPVSVQLTGSKPSRVHQTVNQTGCQIIDVSFPNALHPDVDRILFTNFYTASVSVFVRERKSIQDVGGVDRRGAVDWKQCLRQTTLMPNPHCQENGEGEFTLTPAYPLKNVSELRFILRQPSPCWKEFRIENIKIQRLVQAESPLDSDLLRAWLESACSEKLGVSDEDDGRVKGVGSVREISALMQQLWALTECASQAQTHLTMGRFDVDGCYDINLLSHN